MLCGFGLRTTVQRPESKRRPLAARDGECEGGKTEVLCGPQRATFTVNPKCNLLAPRVNQQSSTAVFVNDWVLRHRTFGVWPRISDRFDSARAQNRAHAVQRAFPIRYPSGGVISLSHAR
jgi:hypothetical protein